MRHLLCSLVAVSALGLSVVAHADTFSATPTFTDSSSNNNSYQFTGTFATSPFTFSGGVGSTYTDQLTITSTNTSCTGRFNPCNADSDDIGVTVSFTLPNVTSGSLSGTGGDDTTYNYVLFQGWVPTDTADIDWTSNTKTVTFTDGSSVLLTLPDFEFSTQDPDQPFSGKENLTIQVLSVPTAPAPEPSSLVLLGTGLVGLGGAVRRKIGL